jgi:hypothetical protein
MVTILDLLLVAICTFVRDENTLVVAMAAGVKITVCALAATVSDAMVLTGGAGRIAHTNLH